MSDSEGNVWVPETGKNALLKLNSSGKVVMSVTPSLGSTFGDISRASIDRDGTLWANDTNNRLVRDVGATRPFLRQITYRGVGNSQYGSIFSDQIRVDNAQGNVTYRTTFNGAFTVSPAGLITASDSLAVGKYVVSGTALDEAGTSGTWTYTLNVLKVQPSVSISSVPSASVHQETVTFTATSSGFDPGTLITFKNGPSSVGTCTLAIATPCTLEISTLAVGNNSITAVVAESAHYLTATSAALTHTVGLQPTSTTFSVSSLPTVGQDITLSAQVTSNSATGTVSFKKPDGTVLCTTSALVSGAGSCVWSGNPGLGTYSVTAVYSGDAAYRTSTSAAASVDVTALYTVTFSTGAPSAVYRTGTTAVPLPLPTRSGFVFDGWFDAAQGGNFIGMAATGYTPTASISLYPHWTQLSLSGIAPADLNLLGTINASDFVDATYSATTNGSSVSISIPQGSLPNQTQVSVHLVGNFDRARALISQTNTYVMTMVISWIAPDGTVPPTDPNKPITMVISNNTIKTGTAVYGLLGGQVTLLGRAVVDGTVTVHITEDPQVVVANTPPTSPITVAATSGLDSRTVISWSEPTNDGGSPVTSYTVTANNGLSCTTTALSCQITGLTNGQSYTFGVVATNVNGESSPSVRTSATPISPISAAGLAQTGQDSNSILLFGFLAVLLGFGFVLIRSRIKK
ncbi:Ig-like domain repeat protein [uncultured Aurantimicrobium sp.]|uniref:Ig-like domain repeat protein n=1 Tax=uncultured Aurantimicrobium sp. TaxID=1705357 RepID=UPI002629E0F0|nr:Ig-like domain repeat protein [uncultured Aurantimicrobium sp.]